MSERLTKNGVRFSVDDSDDGFVCAHTWNGWPRGRTAYIRMATQSPARYLHRELMAPAGELVVDHINGDATDNRRFNLRVCSRRDNWRNRRPYVTSKTGVSGVRWCRHKRRWLAGISLGGRKIALGQFERLEDAIAARRDGELRYYAGFGNLASRLLRPA